MKRQTKTLFWLSFTLDDRFQGVAIVHAANIKTATREATRLGINPGGQAAGFKWNDKLAGHSVPTSYQNRLLTRAECEEFTEVYRHGDAVAEGRELIVHTCRVNQEAM